jgi:hypothetical protein
LRPGSSAPGTGENPASARFSSVVRNEVFSRLAQSASRSLANAGSVSMSERSSTRIAESRPEPQRQLAGDALDEGEHGGAPEGAARLGGVRIGVFSGKAERGLQCSRYSIIEPQERSPPTPFQPMASEFYECYGIRSASAAATRHTQPSIPTIIDCTRRYLAVLKMRRNAIQHLFFCRLHSLILLSSRHMHDPFGRNDGY